MGRDLTIEQILFAIEQVMIEIGLVKYDYEELEERPERPRDELELEPQRILDSLDNILKVVEELLKILEDLVDRELIERFIHLIDLLHQKINKLKEKLLIEKFLKEKLLIEKFRQDLEKSLSPKTANGVPRKEEIRIRWKRLVNGLSNTEVSGGIPRAGKPEICLLIKINEYSFLITLEELGPPGLF